jgi:hypothetical protein
MGDQSRLLPEVQMFLASSIVYHWRSGASYTSGIFRRTMIKIARPIKSSHPMTNVTMVTYHRRKRNMSLFQGAEKKA